MNFETVKETILSGTPQEGKTQVDVVRTILSKKNSSLKLIAIKHGDADLQALSDCRCLGRLRRMAAVNSDESPEQSSYARFKNKIFGVQNENTPIRRRPRRRRR